MDNFIPEEGRKYQIHACDLKDLTLEKILAEGCSAAPQIYHFSSHLRASAPSVSSILYAHLPDICVAGSPTLYSSLINVTFSERTSLLSYIKPVAFSALTCYFQLILYPLCYSKLLYSFIITWYMFIWLCSVSFH